MSDQEPVEGEQPRHFGELAVRPPFWRSPRRLIGYTVAAAFGIWATVFFVGWLLDHLIRAIIVVALVCWVAPDYVRAGVARGRAALERRRQRR